MVNIYWFWCWCFVGICGEEERRVMERRKEVWKRMEEEKEKRRRREEKRRKDVELVGREKKRERVNLVVMCVESRRGKRVERGGFEKSGDCWYCRERFVFCCIEWELLFEV